MNWNDIFSVFFLGNILLDDFYPGSNVLKLNASTGEFESSVCCNAWKLHCQWSTIAFICMWLDIYPSHEKKALGWLGHIGDCTTQLYRDDYNKPFLSLRTLLFDVPTSNHLNSKKTHVQWWGWLVLLPISSILNSGHGPSLSMESMFVGTSQDETGEDNEE